MLLHHYTCAHGAYGIGQDGATKPHRHSLLAGSPAITWLTDLDVPDRGALGLTSHTLRCDRTDYRLDVDQDYIDNLMHWPTAAKEWGINRGRRDLLETGKALPMHWWVTDRPISTAYLKLFRMRDAAPAPALSSTRPSTRTRRDTPDGRGVKIFDVRPPA